MRRRAMLLLVVLLPLAPMAAGEDVHKTNLQDIPLQLGFLFVHHFDQDLEELEKHASWISERDLAVALRLVALADVELDQIVAWRREGSSWDAITRRCQLGCEVFYVALPNAFELAPPYSRPYEAWHARPGSDQRLTDEEVRELVVLQALSDYCQLPPENIVLLRIAGQSPKAIVSVHPAPSQVENAAPPVPALPRADEK